MTGKLTKSNGNTTLEFEWENISPMPELTLKRAAHSQWKRGAGDHGTEEEPVVWENLDEDDYLSIWNDYLVKVTLDSAAQDVHDDAVAVAAETAKEQSELEHGLEM